jgi:hypothetical protein
MTLSEVGLLPMPCSLINKSSKSLQQFWTTGTQQSSKACG